jgi:hypothetical protein
LAKIKPTNDANQDCSAGDANESTMERTMEEEDMIHREVSSPPTIVHESSSAAKERSSWGSALTMNRFRRKLCQKLESNPQSGDTSSGPVTSFGFPAYRKVEKEMNIDDAITALLRMIDNRDKVGLLSLVTGMPKLVETPLPVSLDVIPYIIVVVHVDRDKAHHMINLMYVISSDIF